MISVLVFLVFIVKRRVEKFVVRVVFIWLRLLNLLVFYICKFVFR